MLREWDPSVTANQMDFTPSPFLVHIHNLPLTTMNAVNSPKVGTKLGGLIRYDHSQIYQGFHWFMKMRLKLNIDITWPIVF